MELLNNKLNIGEELTSSAIKDLKKDDESSKVLNKAFAYLARRGHAEKELKDKLRKKGFKGDLIDKAIRRLKELGYVDDEKFARDWIEHRLSLKPKGRIMIKRELLQKGVDILLVEKMLEIVYNRDREKKELRRIFEEKGRFPGSDRRKKEKFVAGLLRRGFLWDDIKELLDSGLGTSNP
jgi:regulatory protein